MLRGHSSGLPPEGAGLLIARAYARQGKTEESGKWLRKAVEAGFNNWNSLKTDADLDNIRDTLYYKKIMEKIGE